MLQIHNPYKVVVLLFFLLFASLTVKAETSDAEDTLAKEVYAALIVADPGEVLYSRVGHCAIHMWAPEYDLDYVFSYEAEDIRQKVLTFLTGNLKMGMFAIPYLDYLNQYRPEGRGVRQYMLNLPLEVKRNLWRVLDEHVAESINLPYNYIERGCAHSTLMMLKEGLDTISIDYGPWPEKFSTMTRQELTGLQLKNCPWTWASLNIIGHVQDDEYCSNEDKLIMPADLVEAFNGALVQGKPLMAAEATVLLPSIAKQERPWFTPFVLSLMLLVLLLLTFIPQSPSLCGKVMRGVLLAIQLIIGLFVVYLVFFSKLCCTEWNWLIIPFNPLPLLCWKWRKYWLLPYAAVLLIWAGFMIFWPHQLTDGCYIVFSIALVALYMKERLALGNCILR